MEKKEKGQPIRTDDLCPSHCYKDRSPEDLLTLTGEGGLSMDSDLPIVAVGMQIFLPLWEKIKPLGQRIIKEHIGRWRLRFLFPLPERRFTHRRWRRLTKGTGSVIPTPSTNSLKTASVLHACYLENDGESTGRYLYIKRKGKNKKIAGPLKLLQVWAYSRKTIEKPIRRRADWVSDVEFPLLLTTITIHKNGQKVQEPSFGAIITSSQTFYLDMISRTKGTLKFSNSRVQRACFSYFLLSRLLSPELEKKLLIYLSLSGVFSCGIAKDMKRLSSSDSLGATMISTCPSEKSKLGPTLVKFKRDQG